jgi:protein-disulfide isomerase
MFLRNNIIQTIAAVIIAVVIIGGSYYSALKVNGQKNTTVGTAKDQTEEKGRPLEEVAPELIPSPLPTGPVDIDTEGDPILGSPDARLEVVEFGDFECPYCKEFASRIIPNLKTDYIDTGKVKFYFKDFPLRGHINGKPAALAANCVARLGGDMKFYQYHDLVFANQEEWAKEDDPGDLFARFAKEISINPSQFEDCYANKETSLEMEKDISEGQKYGVNGTPIFFVNGQVYVGVPPTFEEMKKILDKELEAQ